MFCQYKCILSCIKFCWIKLNWERGKKRETGCWQTISEIRRPEGVDIGQIPDKSKVGPHHRASYWQVVLWLFPPTNLIMKTIRPDEDNFHPRSHDQYHFSIINLQERNARYTSQLQAFLESRGPMMNAWGRPIGSIRRCGSKLYELSAYKYIWKYTLKINSLNNLPASKKVGSRKQ